MITKETGDWRREQPEGFAGFFLIAVARPLRAVTEAAVARLFRDAVQGHGSQAQWGRHTVMEVTLKCHQCGSALPVAVPAEVSVQIDCGRCRQAFLLTFSEAVRDDRQVDRCPVCEGGDFYRRKDFDPKVGVAFMTIVVLISAGFYYYGLDLIAYGVLGAAALFDLVIYNRLSDLSVCYRCHAEFRGNYEQTAGAFDLHTADLLEPEYERKVGLR